MTPDLESHGFMKKRSCSVLQYKVHFSSQPDVSGVSPVCIVLILLLWLSYVCLLSSHLKGSLCLLRAGLGPCVVSGPIWGHLSQTGICQRCSSSTKLQDTFPVVP